MIGMLNGVIDAIGEDFIILDVNGVGYLVQCPARTLMQLRQIGDPVKLAIETQLREDSIKLYGFLAEAERDWFRLLQSVQGVGAKVALAVLGAMTTDELAGAIARQDKTQLGRAPGIGPRLAMRLVTELKDKVPLGGAHGIAVKPGHADDMAANVPAAQDDALAALLTLGYGRPQAGDAVAMARQDLGDAADAAALIRQALKKLSR